MSEYPDSSDPHSGQDAPRTADAPAGQPTRPGLISSGSAPVANRVSEVWAEAADSHTARATASPPQDQPTIRLELTEIEARVLGAMVEKSFLTPDVYPMTTNALATACNQKTNRDPVVDYAAVQIDSTLLELRQRNLVRRVHSQGSRSTKHRQTLDEALALNQRELAVVSVLLLRGPQTQGELRTRTERHDVGFDDLDAIDRCLEALAARAVPLVEMLARQPGHKENRWQHLLGDPRAVAAQPSTDARATAAAITHFSTSSPASPSALSTSALSTSASTQPVAATNGLGERVTELETEIRTLRRQLASLAAKLGEPLD